MLAEIGFFSTLFAFAAALYAIVASVYGERKGSERLVISGRNAALFCFGGLAMGTGLLQVAIMNQSYDLAYVWSVTDPNMTAFFRMTALWGSQAGSLLFWSFLMAAFAAAVIVLNWRSQRRLMPYVVAITMVVTAFFTGITLFYENPFERWWFVGQEVARSVLAPDGGIAPPVEQLAASSNGLNPMLRHFGMAIHPPMLYLGFVGYMIPFAFALAALISGDLSTNWIKASRRWSLVAWLFLGLGLLLGGRWAYDVLGWGGYWGWDPVENAALLPWLTGTAFLHSVMIQEKRGMMKTWNMFLIVGTFSAVIFGTFATRSGLVESVHSFARSEIGFPMFVFWFSMTLFSVVMILRRRNQGMLRDEHQYAGLLSRETLFVVNNLIFVALFVTVFWGSFGAPIVSELFLDTNITLGVDYFNRVTPPLFLAMFILMGVAPLSAWGKTSISRLGRSLLIPVVFAAITVGLMALSGMRSIGAMIGYGVVLVAAYVALYETYRGIAARRRTHKESIVTSITTLFQRNPRRYGGYVIHLGITIIGLGVIGSTVFQVETQRTLAVGESMTIQDYTLVYDSFEGGQIAQDGRVMDIANLTVYRNGELLTHLRPRRDFFPGNGGMESMTIASAHSTLENDFYVLLVDWEQLTQSSATFKVYINPLVNLVWWGGLILILGTLFATWPREVVSARTRAALQANDRLAAAAARGA